MIVGTAGHIDHGKTSLVKALTGVDADRLKEEKQRGITIDLGFAYWPQQDAPTIGFVDVPGHERFVHTMMAGAQGVDVILLVIAADDGVMPQTREHVEIIRLLGHHRGAVALTKIDAVDPARLAAVDGEIAEFLAANECGDWPVHPVSSVTGEGLDQLSGWLRTENRSRQASAGEELFRLAVDRSFILKGAGVVVTGVVLGGTVRVGDEVIVSPAGHVARVRAIHAQNQPAEFGQTGDRCAINLTGPEITKETVRRGDMLVSPAGHAPTARIDAEITVSRAFGRPLVQWMPVRLHHAAAEVGAHIVLLGDTAPQPGETALVQLVLEEAIAARALDRFILRDPSASFTIGGGRLLDLRAPERKRRSPERNAILAALGHTDDGAALAALLEAAEAPVNLRRFAADRGLTDAGMARLASASAATFLSLGRESFALSQQRLIALKAAMRDRLAAFHAAKPDSAGMGLESARLALAPRVPAPLFRSLVRSWAGEGWLALDGNWLRLSTHSIALSLEEENLWFEIAPLLRGSERFRPPRVRDIATRLGVEEQAIRHLMHRCGRLGRVDEVAHDHFFLRQTTGELVRLLEELERTVAGWFTAAQVRDRIEASGGANIGRKVAIQILEFFDSHGVTIRRGDNRKLNMHRRGLFEPAADDEIGREASLVGRPDFKSGGGREPVPGGFDSHSLPPSSPRSGHG